MSVNSRSNSVVIAVNGGSSSIKAAMFRVDAGVPRRVVSVAVDRLGTAGARLVTTGHGNGDAPPTQQAVALKQRSMTDAAAALAAELRSAAADSRIAGIGHRLVFGGATSPDHQLLNAALLKKLRAASRLDSAHLPAELSLISVFQREFRHVAQVACLDTAFHRDLPRVATLLPIPGRFERAGLRRYGFHGLSYEFLSAELSRVERNERQRERVVYAHLGSGASMAAVKNGKPVDTTMGFSPLSGLMMRTRPGDLDAGAIVEIAKREKLSHTALSDFLNHGCGLAGVSGTSGDIRDLLRRRSRDLAACDALDLFCCSARRQLGAMIAALGGIDTLVFAGGVGEHAGAIRAQICANFEKLGIILDRRANLGNRPVISGSNSPVTVRVIPTDEEVMIARHVLRLTRGRR
ncbi:MAG: acetate/propionate family kinase [Phycisphaerae bacterium]|nr:acetate/propionate family kinase [Phycisphaerae bacterium]